MILFQPNCPLYPAVHYIHVHYIRSTLYYISFYLQREYY